MTEPATTGIPTIPTGRIQLGVILPPCPICGRPVENAIDNDAAEDRRLCSVEVIVIRGREPIQLVPCGHYVKSYARTATRVTTWVAE